MDGLWNDGPVTVFLLYTFKEPELLERVSRALAPHPLVVHVDAKVDEAPFRAAVAGTGDRVQFVDDRVLVNWGGYSQVRAIRRLVARGLDLATSDDEYMVMLSGQDYPVKPMQALDKFFDEGRPAQYLRAFVVADSSDHYRRQVNRRHFRDLPFLARRTVQPRLRRLRNIAIRGLEKLNVVMPRLTPPKGLVVAHGGTHFALTAGCLRTLESSVTTEIESYFSKVFCPEENFYHSLLASSPSDVEGWSLEPFQGRGQRRYANLHHIDPTLLKVYTAADWPEVSTFDRFFFRKVSSKASAELLDRIDDELLGLPQADNR